jgi:hypothetical protein
MPIKRVNVPQFVTSDGTQFLDEVDALRHQSHLDHSTSVDAYLAAEEVPSRNAANVRKHILAYLAFASSPQDIALAEAA